MNRLKDKLNFKDRIELKGRIDSEKLKSIKLARNKVIKGTSAAVVVLSILTGLAFSGPAEISADQVGTQINQPPVVMDIGDYANTNIEDDDDDATEEKKGFSAVIQRFKQAVLSLPKAVRILIITPMWAIGTGIMTVISVFWNVLFASPVGGFVLSVFAGFCILLGLYVLTAKVLFPDVPVKKLLNKRSIISIAVVSILLGLADAIVPLFWNKYPIVTWLVKLSTGVVTVSLLSARVKRMSISNLLPQAA